MPWSEATSLGFALIFCMSAASLAGSTGVAAPAAAVVSVPVGVPEMPGTSALLPIWKTKKTIATASTAPIAPMILFRCGLFAASAANALGGGGDAGVRCWRSTAGLAVIVVAAKRSCSGPDRRANALSTSVVRAAAQDFEV